jgi:hypothetical protein
MLLGAPDTLFQTAAELAGNQVRPQAAMPIRMPINRPPISAFGGNTESKAGVVE